MASYCHHHRFAKGEDPQRQQTAKLDQQPHEVLVIAAHDLEVESGGEHLGVAHDDNGLALVLLGKILNNRFSKPP